MAPNRDRRRTKAHANPYQRTSEPSSQATPAPRQPAQGSSQPRPSSQQPPPSTQIPPPAQARRAVTASRQTTVEDFVEDDEDLSEDDIEQRNVDNLVLETAGTDKNFDLTTTTPIFAKRLARFGHAFMDPSDMIDAAIAVARDANALKDPSCLKRYNVFMKIYADYPKAIDIILEAEAEVLESYKRRLKYHQGQCRHADVSTTAGSHGRILGYIRPSELGEEIEPPSPVLKSARGYRHSRIAALYVPACLAPLTPALQVGLLDGTVLIDGRAPDGRDFPIIFYLNLEYNPQRKLVGLFKGDTLIRTAKCIAIGPAAGSNHRHPDVKENHLLVFHVPIEARGSKGGNAEIAGMRSVSTAFISYVCCIVYYALDPSTVFAPIVSPRITQVYEAVLALLSNEHPTMRKFTKHIIDYWNQELFPHMPDVVLRNTDVTKGSVNEILADLPEVDEDDEFAFD